MQTANAFARSRARYPFSSTLSRPPDGRGVERLSGFDQTIAAARAAAVTPPVIEIAPGDGAAIALKDLALRCQMARRWSLPTI